MQLSRLTLILFLLSILAVSACRSKQDGYCEGTVVPAGTSARITAIRDGKDVLSVHSGTQDGKFKLALAAGVYSINVVAPGSPYPLRVNNVVVKSGETTVLPPIALTPQSGTGVLTGTIMPPRPDTEVKLIYEGKERAAIHTDREGKYEFKELPAGSYVLQAIAPGHADDTAQVVVPENQKVEQNAVLLPIVSIDGVDWTAGKIRATGTGIPPQNIANGSIRREMAKRAALVDAQRNLIRTIELIRIDENRDVKTAMRNRNVAIKVQGFLKGYVIVSERELESGKIEVVLELPLTGPTGLSRYITE